MDEEVGPSLSTLLQARVHAAIEEEGGWLPFDRFMAMALYEPGLGYYANDGLKFGAMPASGSDFVTAPEMSPLFGRALAVQVDQALRVCGSSQVWEFGAGSGALAAQLMEALGDRVCGYHIVELSASLRSRQGERLRPWEGRVHWHDRWPEAIGGVVLGNEVLDAMPVQLLHWNGHDWLERGVAFADGRFVWADRPTPLRPPVAEGFEPGTVVEIHRQTEAFVRTLAERMQRCVAFFIDYGFPEAEFYHPQRTAGTLMCHRAHHVDADPLVDLGRKDITAHVNFSGIALAAQEAGLNVLGYTSQAWFLLNCGLDRMMGGSDARTSWMAHRLVQEHEMGELFKVIGIGRGVDFDAVGFSRGDRSHRL